MFKRVLLGAFAALGLLTVAPTVQAQGISQRVAVCNKDYPSRCVAVAADGSIPTTGGGGGGGNTTVTATAAAPSYVEGSTTNPLSTNLTGDLRTIAKQNGTWTVGLSAGAETIGTVNLGTIGGAATAALQGAQGTGSTYNPPTGGSGEIGYLSGIYAAAIDTTDVGVRLNSIAGTAVATGNGVVSAGVQRVAIASDNTAFSTNSVQSGTWTVQPGNTANTTPWLVQARGWASPSSMGCSSGVTCNFWLSQTGAMNVQIRGADATSFVTITTPAAGQSSGNNGMLVTDLLKNAAAGGGTSMDPKISIQNLTDSISGRGVQTVEDGGSSYRHITTNTTTDVKASAAILRSVCVNTKGASANTLTIYDNTTGGTSNVFAVIDTTAGPACWKYEAGMANGIQIATATGTPPDVTVIFR